MASKTKQQQFQGFGEAEREVLLIAMLVELRIHHEPFEQWQLRETLERPQAEYLKGCYEAWTITSPASEENWREVQLRYEGLINASIGKEHRHLLIAVEQETVKAVRRLVRSVDRLTEMTGGLDSEAAQHFGDLLREAVNPFASATEARRALNDLGRMVHRMGRPSKKPPESPQEMTSQAPTRGLQRTLSELLLGHERTEESITDVLDLLSRDHDLPTLLTPTQASRLTGIGATSLRAAFDRGEIVGTRIGQHRKLDVESVRAWCRSQEKVGQEAASTGKRPKGRAPKRFIPR